MIGRFSLGGSPPLSSYHDDEKAPLQYLDVATSTPLHNRHLLRPRITLKALLAISCVVASVVMSYVAQGWSMDKASADAMRALDLKVAPSLYGKKTIDFYGRLRRADTNVVCKTVTVDGQPVDYSNGDICMSNAEKHANCIRVCDDSFSSCGGCAALAADRANQLAIAQANCNYKSSFSCPLSTQSNGAYNYVALSTCCLQSRPPGPDACMCDYQQSASALCILSGVCLGASTCQKSSLQCVGTSSAQPLAVCSVPGALSCTGSGSSEVDLTCGVASATQYYLNPTTSRCVTSCPSGLVNTVISGVGTCVACSGNGVGAGVTSCSGSTALSCGTASATQYYLSAGACVSTCPSGSSSSVAGTVGTCSACSGDGLGTGVTTCSGSSALTCGLVSGTQYYLSSGACVTTCPSGSSSSVVGTAGTCSACSGNGLGTGVTTCSGSSALTCGRISGTQYYLSSGACVTTCPSGSSSSVVGTAGTCSACSGNGLGTGVTTCSGSSALTCGLVSGTQYYLSSGACVTTCPSGSSSSVVGTAGTCSACSGNGLGTGVTTCSGSSALTCGRISGTQYYLSSGACVTTCPSGSSSSVVGTAGTCSACSGNGLGTGVTTCSGSSALTCGLVSGTQYFLTAGACVATCPTGSSGSVSGANGVCTVCAANAATCDSSGNTLTCAQDGSVTYSLNTLTGLCVSVCPSGYLSIASGVLGAVCQSCSGTGTGTCSGLGAGLALTCTTANSVQYYLQAGYCVTAANCPAGSGTLSLGVGTCNQCADAGATTCTSTSTGSATSCGILVTSLLQTYLTTSKTCSLAATCNLVAGQSAILYNGKYVCQVCAAHTRTCSGPNANQATSCAYNALGSYYLTKSTSTCLTSCTAGSGGGTPTCALLTTCSCV